jgi:hypothetical protein
MRLPELVAALRPVVKVTGRRNSGVQNAALACGHRFRSTGTAQTIMDIDRRHRDIAQRMSEALLGALEAQSRAVDVRLVAWQLREEAIEGRGRTAT